ncbi:LPD7 domain-containing protein [Burkholderia cenocepacia]|uniref:LPD7 domain-containing protein n=1 Tax=Burkholderia cenocepacia TaxID=95486 RepID=UPI002B24A076|nr:LPD7 domain-containing protein [Burkholderia cenocepacia]MEB2558802.1 LPD7 domain-containing protein [Burkholderia cenocepacia]
MLIRPTGRHDGVKQYLEDGQKVGRELSRDELDERVVLVGDLDLTDAVIQAIDAPPKVERYLSITLSFKEDHVERDTLLQIAREFEAFAMHAYRPDEYSFYAEAHLPRVKSYIDQATGELVERKPHIHVVIPKRNLVSGQSLRPFGFDKHNTHYIDAFQEHTNAKYGLASPKDNRRTLLTDASEMISRYRGDLFRANSRELKEQILDAVLDRQIEDHADFMALLQEHGAVRMRNADRDDAYPNVKPADADKGVNLKEYVFTSAFIELPTAEKLQALSADAADQYESGVAPRRTPDAITALLNEWYATRARELKYLNSGSRQYQRYQDSSPHDRELMLADLERGFYAQHLKAHHDRADDSLPGLEGHLRRDGRAFEYGAQPSDAVDELDAREIDFHAPEWEPGWGADDVPGRVADGYDGLEVQFDFVAGGAHPAPDSVDALRNVSGRPVDGVGDRSAVLLPGHALHQLEPNGTVPADRLRRPEDRAGEPAAQRVAGPAPGELDAYHRALEAHYAFGDPFDSLPPMRPPAARAPAGTGMSLPGWYSGRQPDPFLDRFDAIDAAFDFDAAQPIVLRQPEIPADVPPYRSRRSRAGDDAFDTPRRTGRVADNVLSQLARDVRQRDETGGQYAEFREIQRALDAQRLLAELSHTHGVRPAKYAVVTGRDGADRIRAGKRSLNVSDFLTKELNLSWREAAPLLRAVYQRQQAGEPPLAPRELPRAALWREYSVAREAHVVARSDAWLAQRASEQHRRGENRAAFDAARAAIKQDVSLTPARRRAATSLARADHLGRDDALRESIARERAVLKEQFGAAAGPSFTDWLRTQADRGDERALEELRRTARPESAPANVDAAGETFNIIRANTQRPPAADEYNAIIFRSSGLSWSVDERGHVTYRHDGRDVVRDRGASVQVLQADRSSIETGLRLAQSKFGRTLELAGNDAYQLAAAKVAVDAGLHVQFSDARLNRAMDQYRHARVDQQVRDVLGTPAAGARTTSQPQPDPDRPTPNPAMPSDDGKPTL